MSIIIPPPSRGPLNQGKTFQARLVHPDGSGQTVTDEGKALQQADFASIACAVYNLDSATPDTAVATPTVTVVTDVLDALTDDEIWTEDSIGKNFSHFISGSVFSAANLYRIVYTATLSAGLDDETMAWSYQHQAIALTTDSPYRANQGDVADIIDVDSSIDLLPFIKFANLLTTRVATCATNRNRTLSSAELAAIEAYLAAHFYAIRDRQLKSKRTERAAGTYDGKTDKGLDSTLWGQTAKDLDTSGCLESFGGRTGRLVWLGKVPSDQINYEDRD